MEAPGEHEAATGVPVVGKAGHALFTQLKRVGIDREGFRIHNVLSCRPPDNKLAGMPYEKQAIAHCSPNLYQTILEQQVTARENGKTFVILTMGRTAFKRVMGLDESTHERLLKEDYTNYPFWNEQYKAWVIAVDHPSYLMRGNHHLWPTLTYGVQRALEIANSGLTLDTTNYLLDPMGYQLAAWYDEFENHYSHNEFSTYLSYDIETPMKRGQDEEKVSKESDDDYTILRVSFCYKPGHAVSLPWNQEFLPFLKRIFAHPTKKLGWNNCPTPDQRVLTDDLRWIPAGELEIGDRLIGMTEHVPNGHRLRRYKTSVVTHATRGTAEVFCVSFSDGTSVKVTGEHPWLVSQRHQFGADKKGSTWVKTRDLRVGQFIQRLLDTWCEDTSKEAGYLAGFFDGEGHLSKAGGSMRVGAAQNNGPTLDYVLSLLEDKRFRNKRKSHKRLKDIHLSNFVIQNGINGSARFLGSIRPKRLLSKFDPECLGAVWHLNTSRLTITSIESIGFQEIVELSTSEKTYLLEGFAAHNSNYDFPRVLKAVGEVNGDQIDGMLAWHVVNSSLPKGLGFVTPFYWPNTTMWKHLSDSEPAFYNAKDADAALRNWLGIEKDLVKNNQSHVFDRHVIEVNRVFDYMRKKGVPFDKDARDAAERKVGGILAEIDAEIEATVPIEARQLKVYKKTPADTAGLVEIVGEKKVKVCPNCRAIGVDASHFKSIGKKRLKLGETENPCFGSKSCADIVTSRLWAKPLPFKLSQKQLLAYQGVKNQKPIWNKKENRITFDEDAINRLLKKYPNDPLYPLIDSRRQPGKLLSTYIGRTVDGVVVGGIPVDPDGMIRTTFTHNPSTLRSASQRPNLQNIPRINPNNINDIANLIRGLFVASPGHTFWAADYSGIEALLCGYFANYPEYMRLTKIDVHSFYTAYAIYELDKRIPANDLPLLSWNDEKLATRLAEIKKEFKADRNNLYKHLVHGNNFMQGVEGSQRKIYLETGVEPPFALVKKVMDVYFGLFPGIKSWHNRLLLQASDQGYLRNPFGYVHRFNRVFEWEKLYGSEWSKKPGPQANEVIAFLPQSTAAGIIKEAMLRIFQNHFERAGQYLRLLIHDELFFMVPHKAVEILARIVQEEMEKPIPEMPMLPEWNMGSHLWVGTESKMGDKWSLMK